MASRVAGSGCSVQAGSLLRRLDRHTVRAPRPMSSVQRLLGAVCRLAKGSIRHAWHCARLQRDRPSRQLYVDGFNDGDFRKFQEAFHEDAWIFFTDPDGVLHNRLISEAYQSWAVLAARSTAA